MPAILTPLASGEEAFALVDAAGDEHELSQASGYMVLYGVDNRWSPPVEYDEVMVPFLAGAQLRQVNIRPRDVPVPLWIGGETRAQRNARIAQLAAWLDPTRGDVRWRNRGTSGDWRELVGRASLRLSEEVNEAFGNWALAMMLLHAGEEPYWLDTADTVQTFTLDTTAIGWTGNPWEPFRVQSSLIFSATIVLNDGDAEAYPRWTIDGPGSAIALHNLTTGERLEIDTTLAAGDQVLIDTTPGVGSVTNGEGTNLLSATPVDAPLWALGTGSQTVRIEMNGADAVTSAVELRYVRRWHGPPP